MKSASFRIAFHLVTVHRKQRCREGALYQFKIHKKERPNLVVFIGRSSLVICKLGLRLE